MESLADQERTAAFPDAIRTIIVSPMARPNPSTQAASTPGDAPGSTTRQAVCQREAPMATDPSRNLCGTDENASSETVYTIGITARLRPIPAVVAFSRYVQPNALCSQPASTIRQKKPTTTLGIPARISIAG